MTLSGCPVEVMRPPEAILTVLLAMIVRVRVVDADSVITAVLLQATEPRAVFVEVLEALKVTFLLANSLAKLVTEIFEVAFDANQTPVVPKNEPAVSVDPETTFKVSA